MINPVLTNLDPSTTSATEAEAEGLISTLTRCHLRPSLRAPARDSRLPPNPPRLYLRRTRPATNCGIECKVARLQNLIPFFPWVAPG